MYREFKDYLNNSDKAVVFWDSTYGLHIASDDFKKVDIKLVGKLKELSEAKRCFHVHYDIENIKGLSRNFRTLKATYYDSDIDEIVHINLDNQYDEYTCVDGVWDWRAFEGDMKNVG